MELLGRDSDIRQFEDAIRSLRDRRPGLFLIRGSAGIGKTALLDRGRELAAEAGLATLYASGGELEREFPYGVVRQLFEQLLFSMPEDERNAALSGAAQHSAPVVAPYLPRATAGQSDDFAVVHGLYWLTVNLAQRGPLLIVVDDAHWADRYSLRFVGHLARRLEGLPIAVLMGYRPGEVEATEDVLRVVAAEPLARIVDPAPLDADAVTALLERTFGTAPEPAFVTACRSATGGNPFLVLELARALAGSGVQPTAAAAPLTDLVGPTSVAEAITARLSRVPGGALELARAVAVLGQEARLDLAAAVAGLEAATAARLADALSDALLFADSSMLSFAHPVMRSAVYDAMTPLTRSAAHARAAELLAEERADPDAVATHLLACEPTGNAGLVRALRLAAEHARDRGAPESAATYLRRAIEEGGPAARDPGLLRALGMAEKLARLPDAAQHLREAVAAAESPEAKVRIACELSEILATTGQWADSLAVLDELREEAASDHAAAVRLETQFATVASWDPKRVPEFERKIPDLLDLLDRDRDHDGDSGRLALTVAANLSMRGAAEERALSLLKQGLADGDFVREEGPDVLELQIAGSVLVNAELLDEAGELAEQILEEAHRRGSAYGFFNGTVMRARAATRAGDLDRASQDLRLAFDVMGEHGLLLGVGSMLVYGADTIAERPELADLSDFALALQCPEILEGTPIGMVIHTARGRARLSAGDLAGAAEDLTAAGLVAEAVAFFNPNALCWRSPLAIATRGSDPDRALDLARDELAEAERIGHPRAVGVALRTLGMLRADVAQLRRATEVLDRSPARLEHARALFELGAALRRANQRTEAREILRKALVGAERCGGIALAAQVRKELLAAGARPRRQALVGVDALTPSERRVAQMAASGLSNPEIAQALFVSLNTVETHLRHAFRKLDISRRTQLADVV